MELTTTETIEKKIQIKTPAYFKSSCHYVKLTEEYMIIVCDIGTNKRIVVNPSHFFDPRIYDLPSDEKEFKKAHKDIQTKINKLINQ